MHLATQHRLVARAVLVLLVEMEELQRVPLLAVLVLQVVPGSPVVLVQPEDLSDLIQQ
jgi:hypothetical protein